MDYPIGLAHSEEYLYSDTSSDDFDGPSRSASFSVPEEASGAYTAQGLTAHEASVQCMMMIAEESGWRAALVQEEEAARFSQQQCLLLQLESVQRGALVDLAVASLTVLAVREGMLRICDEEAAERRELTIAARGRRLLLERLERKRGVVEDEKEGRLAVVGTYTAELCGVLHAAERSHAAAIMNEERRKWVAFRKLCEIERLGVAVRRLEAEEDTKRAELVAEEEQVWGMVVELKASDYQMLRYRHLALMGVVQEEAALRSETEEEERTGWESIRQRDTTGTTTSQHSEVLVCPTCTFETPKSSVVCDMCRMPLFRSCSTCTAMNPAKATRCTECNAPLPVMELWECPGCKMCNLKGAACQCGVWQCRCQNTNPPTSRACGACGSPEGDGAVRCPGCQAGVTSLRCEACKADLWRCSQCSVVNFVTEEMTCTSCDYQANPWDIPVRWNCLCSHSNTMAQCPCGRAVGTWGCRHCHTLNTEEDLLCSRCGRCTDSDLLDN